MSHHADRKIASSEPRAVALVVHGLNTKPEKMQTIASALNEIGIETQLVTLSGHDGDLEQFKQVTREKWLADARSAYDLASRRANELHVPLYLVGFSLGAVVYADLGAHFDRMVLFAPALVVRGRSRMIQALSIMGQGFVVPSMNNEAYRASVKGTPVAAYTALFESIDAVANKGLAVWNVPTLVLVDPDDELVSPSGIQKMIDGQRLDQWRMIPITAIDSSLDPSYHHLVIDAQALGAAEWGQVREAVQQHFLGRDVTTHIPTAKGICNAAKPGQRNLNLRCASAQYGNCVPTRYGCFRGFQ